MGKKKRNRKTNKSRYLSFEGYDEKVLYNFLYDLYELEKNNIKVDKPKIPPGGNQASILRGAIKNCNTGRDMCVAWFDDDFKIKNKDQHENFIEALSRIWKCEIEKDIEYKNLQKTYNENCDKEPILIVSNPCSFEGLILRIFDKKIPEKLTTDNLKKAVDGLFGKLKDTEYYKKYLTKELLEKKRKEIYELDLLLKIFEN